MKTCFVCDRELPSHRQRFCTDRCSYIHRVDHAKKRRKKLQLDPINCFTCGEQLIPKTTRQMYCSKHCWTVEQIKRRDAKRMLLPDKGKIKRSKRFTSANWGTVVFNERTVTEAKFTKADSKERVDIQSAVERYLSNGGKITKYGDQPAKIEIEGEIKWQIDKTEEKDIQDELARLWRVNNVLGD